VPLFLATKAGVTDMEKSGVATTGALGAGAAWPSMAGAASASMYRKSVNVALRFV
jgi:hypothetical protein